MEISGSHPDPIQENYAIVPEISQFLNELNIKDKDYYDALKISTDTDFPIRFKYISNSCFSFFFFFLSNYFTDSLMAWKAIIDIQPIFNHYKVVTYMCAYFWKAKNEISQAMRQAVKEAFISG